MLKKILFPTDGSEESGQCIPVVKKLAMEQGAEVILAQVVQYPVMVEDFEGYSAQMWQQVFDASKANAQANLTVLAADLNEAGILTSQVLDEGSPAAVLLDIERDQQVDLLVMSTHGRTGLARFALGSVADRMVREGTAPVLLVRAKVDEPTMEKALLMLDGSGASEGALPVVESLANHPLREVKLLRVVVDAANRGPAATYLAGVADRLEKAGLRTEVAAEVGDAASLVEKAAEGADLVVLSTHGRGGFDRIRHGSVAERVVREVTKPVLLVRVEA